MYNNTKKVLISPTGEILWESAIPEGDHLVTRYDHMRVEVGNGYYDEYCRRVYNLMIDLVLDPTEAQINACMRLYPEEEDGIAVYTRPFTVYFSPDQKSRLNQRVPLCSANDLSVPACKFKDNTWFPDEEEYQYYAWTKKTDERWDTYITSEAQYFAQHVAGDHTQPPETLRGLYFEPVRGFAIPDDRMHLGVSDEVTPGDRAILDIQYSELARNPNTPPDILARLAPQYQAAFGQNPIMPLLLLESPDWILDANLGSFRTQTLTGRGLPYQYRYFLYPALEIIEDRRLRDRIVTHLKSKNLL